jgi:hypothetical protein
MIPINLRHESPQQEPKPKENITSSLTTLSSRLILKNNNTGADHDGISCDDAIGKGLSKPSDIALNESLDDEDDIGSELLPLNLSQDGENELSNTKLSFWENCRSRRGRSSPIPSTRNGSERERARSPNSARNMTLQLKGGIARFFSSSQESNEYAPSGPMVASAGIDLCIPVLFNFHLFMMASKSSTSTNDNSNDRDKDDDIDDDTEHSIPPQVLPLLFLAILAIRTIFPFKARTRFWTTVQSVISCPFYNVTFRDAFLGDVLTSLVRPLQDIIFAIFYFFAAMYGIFTGKISLEDTGSRLTHNILLHNIVLPTCAVLPLLCRFFQTLRQAYDEQRRWPHLGNAFKYLTASLVISYGMTHSEEVRSPLWIISFVLCTFQQIWWDIIIDWELITISSEEKSGGIFIPFIGRIQLRSKRLFKSDRSYWRIIILNSLFRFTWMLSFIPAYHLNTMTREIKGTFSQDIKSVVGFVVSLAELVRRSAWCILKLELETIKLTDDEYICGTSCTLPSARIQYPCFAPNERIEESLCGESPPPLSSTRISMKRAAYRLLVKKLFILELFLWAALYIGLGFIASVCL